jgi:hypothetical protein
MRRKLAKVSPKLLLFSALLVLLTLIVRDYAHHEAQKQERAIKREIKRNLADLDRRFGK